MCDRVGKLLHIPVRHLELGGTLLHPLFQTGIEAKHVVLRLLAFGDVSHDTDKQAGAVALRDQLQENTDRNIGAIFTPVQTVKIK